MDYITILSKKSEALFIAKNRQNIFQHIAYFMDFFMILDYTNIMIYFIF